MSQFRIYKRLNYDWAPTSYAGEMFALKKRYLNHYQKVIFINLN